MNGTQIVLPEGAMGASSRDDALVSALRQIGREFEGDPSQWAEKYGERVDSAVFTMRPYCWCEHDTCPYCRSNNPLSNFVFKPTGFAVRWYKYIGRDMEINREITPDEVADMLRACLASKQEAPK